MLKMDEEIKNKIIEIINSVMNIDVNSFDKSRKLNTISEWDSFNNLMLIAKFQEDFGLEFTVIEIENIQTIGDVLNALEEKYEEMNN